MLTRECTGSLDPAATPGIRVWEIDLDAASGVGVEGMLPREELERAVRMRPMVRRQRFLARRVALRRILGSALGEEPAAVSLTQGWAGKPEVTGAGLDFSVSYSGGRGIVALGVGCLVGTDLELNRRVPDAGAIAAITFSSSEQDELLGLDPLLRDGPFLVCWTRKEAAAKALGCGFRVVPREFDVGCAPSPRLVRVPSCQCAVTVLPLPVRAGAVASLGIAAKASASIARWRLRGTAGDGRETGHPVPGSADPRAAR